MTPDTFDDLVAQLTPTHGTQRLIHTGDPDVTLPAHPKREPHQRIPATERPLIREHLAQRYNNGESIRTLSEDTGHSYGSVHNLLLEAGVTLRGRGGPNRRKTTAQIIDEHEAGRA